MRDLALDRALLDTAARAAGFTGDGGYGTYRHAGPYGNSFGCDSDVRRSLSDARDVLLGALADDHAGFLTGDADACESYHRRMRALSGLVTAWYGLHSA